VATGGGRRAGRLRGAVAAAALVFAALSAPAGAATLDARRGEPLGSVSREFVSFGFDISQMQERRSGLPFDFARPRLVRLAKALRPAYVRYSGTKIDETYYDPTGTLGPNPPGAFKYVLDRDEWDAANRFAAAAGLKVTIGINGGPGPRNADFSWNPDNARALLERAAATGRPPAVVSFANEPNLTYYGSGNPPTYQAADYAADVQRFLVLRAELAPRSTFIGPGSFFITGAEKPILNVDFGPQTAAIMPLLGNRYDAVSLHHYPAFGDSAKCAGLQPRPPADPLAPEFLDRIEGALAYMRGLRDAHAPGRPLWVDEFGNTACGGVVGYSNTFAASFYYLNALGTMARSGVRVATRWTLAGPQPYALVDDTTLTPRPDYWAALLWRRLMGTRVLTTRLSDTPAAVRAYSTCTPGSRGGVTTLALNTDRTAAATIHLAGLGGIGAAIHRVTGDLGSEQVSLNGRPLALSAAGKLPNLSAARVVGGKVTLPPASYAFITQPYALSRACGWLRR
jgi:heparanase